MKIIIKLSGKIIDNKDAFNNFIGKLKKLTLRNKVILIHGGGIQVSSWMEKLSLKPKFVEGLRFTDDDTLEVVISVLCGLINKKLVYELINYGFKKVLGLSCIDDKLVVTDIDEKLGYVGKNVLNVNTNLINFLLNNKYLLVISSVGLGKKDNKFVITNINADNVVYALASHLKADKVIFLTDKEGVLDEDNKVIRKLSLKEIDELIVKKIVTEGMIPKLSAIKDMFKRGVSQVIITNDLGKVGTSIVK